MADNETIADIIAEIRALSNPISDGIIAINGKSIADRLEAAHRRERGDCAKLRDALVSAIGTLKKLYAQNKRTAGHIVTCRQKCEAALATISNQNIQEQ